MDNFNKSGVFMPTVYAFTQVTSIRNEPTSLSIDQHMRAYNFVRNTVKYFEYSGLILSMNNNHLQRNV
jgi:hypothetical protein